MIACENPDLIVFPSLIVLLEHPGNTTFAATDRHNDQYHSQVQVRYQNFSGWISCCSLKFKLLLSYKLPKPGLEAYTSHIYYIYTGKMNSVVG